MPSNDQSSTCFSLFGSSLQIHGTLLRFKIVVYCGEWWSNPARFKLVGLPHQKHFVELPHQKPKPPKECIVRYFQLTESFCFLWCSVNVPVIWTHTVTKSGTWTTVTLLFNLMTDPCDSAHAHSDSLLRSSWHCHQLVTQKHDWHVFFFGVSQSRQKVKIKPCFWKSLLP